MTTTDIIAFSIIGASSVIGGFSLLVIRQLIEQLRSLTATVGSMKKVVATLEESTNEARKARQDRQKQHDQRQKALTDSLEIQRIAGLGPQAASEAMALGQYGRRPPIILPLPNNEGFWREDHLNEWPDLLNQGNR